MSNVASVDTRGSVLKHLSTLSRDKLTSLAVSLNLISEISPQEDEKLYAKTYSKEFLLDLMVRSQVI